MNPYSVFAEVVKSDPKISFRDVWFDFEAWERARGFRDDPSAPSKEALDWIRSLYDLTVTLEAFEGPGKDSCQHALETAFVAFARLDHPKELCEAVELWRKWRRGDEESQSEPDGQ